MAANTADKVPQSLNHGLTSAELHDLKAACIAAKSLAYCPYSQFHVGAALLTSAGRLVPGANVENASYPVGMCAERVALGTAVVSEGCKMGDFKALAVATDVWPAASPCGMCRQALREFCELPMPIFMYDRDGEYVVKTMGELLPMSFGPQTLPNPTDRPAYEKT